MKKLIGIGVATVAVLAIAIGYQAFGASSNEEEKAPPPATSTDSPAATPSDDATKEDDGAREGYTEDNAGKPGETKD